MRIISIDNLQAGMKLSLPIRDDKDNILLNRNVELTARYISRLKQLGYQNVYISDPDLMDVKVEPIISDANRAATNRHLRQTYQKLDRVVHDLKKESTSKIISSLQSSRFKKAFNQTNVYHSTVRVVGDVIEDVITSAALNGLNTLKTFDSYTFTHSLDMTIASILIARKLGFVARDVQTLAVGCLLHDVGKVFIPLEILNKPNRLNTEEFEVIKKHPVIGYEMLRNMLPTTAACIANQHHEKQDGSGYPQGMSGRNKIKRPDYDNSITLMSEIASIADVYDALTSDRPYRKAMLHDEAIDLLSNSAYSHFNAEVLEKFLSIVPKFPVGSNFEILSGERKGYTGVVIAVDEDNLNVPTIRILFDTNGKRVKPVDVNLRKHMETRIKLIEG